MATTKSRLSVLTAVVVFILSAFSGEFVWAQATLENPAPGSFQSGIGIISGWACAAQSIEIVFNDGPPQQAAYGTSRGDTHTACGDTDNGFGLLFNWNLLGDGYHTVQALADGVEFAQVQVHVTTLGAEFLEGAEGTAPLTDFPTPGRTLTLRWQPAQQNFAITDGNPVHGGGTSGAPPHVLENPAPGSFQSGLGLISGWVCDAQTITIRFDDGPPQEAAYGTSRGDTQGACGDTDNGFGLLFNWNLLGDGLHTVSASADGVEFARVEVTVTTLGTEFRRGVSREVTLPDFPEAGADVALRWQEAQQNFVIIAVTPTERLVSVRPEVSLPASVTSVQQQDVSITSLVSPTGQVRASPEPTLLLAEDEGGTVLLSIANKDGGLLGETDGKVGVNINSTAATLVALAAGYSIADIDRSVVDQITAHVRYPTLLAALTQALAADKNVLDRIFDYPEVVTLIREVASFRTDTGQAAQQLIAPQSTLSQQRTGVPPEGIRKEHADVQGSDWETYAPWQWFGDPGGIFASFFPRPPFLASSVDYILHASANPNFVSYALELYSNTTYKGWLYVPGNASLLDKRSNAGAAYREITTGAGALLNRSIDRVRFERYRVSGTSSRAKALSFVNTLKGLMAVVNLLVNVKAVSKWLDRLPLDKVETTREIVACGREIEAATRRPTATSVDIVQILHFLRHNVPVWTNTLLECRKLNVVGLQGAISEEIIESIARAAGLMTPLGWVRLAFTGANEVVPVWTSYLAPAAGSVEYHLVWAEDENDRAYIACASGSKQEADSCIPPGPTNLRITEVGADFVDLAWDAPAGGGAGSYNIYYRASANGPEELLDNVRTAGRRITGTVVPGECYRVSAVSAAGVESEKTAQVCVEEPSSPLTNLNLRITEVGVNFIDLEWDPLPEGEAESYIILYQRPELGFYDAIAATELGTVETTSVRLRGRGNGPIWFTVKAVSQLWIADSGDPADRWDRLQEEDVWAGKVRIMERSSSRSDEGASKTDGWCLLVWIGTHRSDGHPVREDICDHIPRGETCRARARDLESWLFDNYDNVRMIVPSGGLTSYERCKEKQRLFFYTLEPVPQTDDPPGS